MTFAQQSVGSSGADPVAARLAEVEGTIARDRVSKQLKDGTLELHGGGSAAADQARPAATGSVSNQAVMPVASRDGANGGSFGAFDAGTAGGNSDAARSALLDNQPHPATQLAAKGIGLLANQRGGAITMRLEPPALGQLRIELQINQGAVVADFTAASPEARVLLEANLGMLRERLESQGLSVERISVHGGRGTESATLNTAQGGSDARQEGADARSDGRDGRERSSTRQDAAGGESRGRRDGEPRTGRDRTDAVGRNTTRGFAGVLDGVTARRTDPMRRVG